MNLWRKIFPKYDCKFCQDTGVEHDCYSIRVCRHRDMAQEMRGLTLSFAKCVCKPFKLIQDSGSHFVCATCGVTWGKGIV